MRWKELLSSGTAFLLLLAIAFTAFNWLVPHLILWMRVPNAISGVYRFLHYAGALVGEGCVIVIFASLYWRHWLIGFLAGVVVFAAIVFGSMAAGEMFAEVDSFRAATALPAVTLAVSLPLLLIRIVRGWQLVLPGQTSAARESVGVRDLLIGMAVIAGTFAIMRLPFAHENNWDDLAFAALLLVAVAVSGSIVPLAAWFALCVRNGITAILGLAFLPACIFVAGATLLVLFGKPGQSRSDLAEGFSQIAGVFRFPFFCFYFGLACMQWRGFSIVTANRKDA